MPPFLLEVSSSGALSSLVSLTPNLEVPRGNADRLLSNTPQPMMTGFDVQMDLMRKGRPASLEIECERQKIEEEMPSSGLPIPAGDEAKEKCK